MEKEKYNKQKLRNAEIVSSLIDIETNMDNLVDELEIVTKKKFSEFIPANNKIASKGGKGYKVKNKVSKKELEDARKDASSELEKAQDTLNRLFDIARKYNLQGTENEEDNFVVNTEKKVYELFEKLKNGPLNNEEFSDLVELTRQMNFNELVRNYVDMGITVTCDKIEKLEKQENNKVFMVFKPVITKFRQKFKKFKDNEYENPELHVQGIKGETKGDSLRYEDYIDDVNNNLFNLLLEDDFESIMHREFSEKELDDLLNKTEKLKGNYEKLNLPTNDDFYSKENISERDTKWSEYAGTLIETIGELQAMHLKNCYADIRKYAVSKTASGTIVCQIGDKHWPISKDNLVDDIAKFYQMKEEYEKTQEITEEKSKEEEKVEEKIDVVDTPSIIIDPEIVLPEEKEETTIEEIKESEEETKAEETIQEPSVEEPLKEEVAEPIVETEVQSEVIEPEADVIEPIDFAKQAYIEVMSCFVDRAEAERLATEENVSLFETSNLGYGKYIEAINAGEITNDASYEDFVVNQIQKDNGIKYDSDLEEELDNYKEDSEIGVIDDTPIIIENVQSESDLSGYDQMLSVSEPHIFSDVTQPITNSRRR